MFLDTPLLSCIIWLPITVGCVMLIFDKKNFNLFSKFIIFIISTISLFLYYKSYENFTCIVWIPAIVGFIMLIFNKNDTLSKIISLLTSVISLFLCYELYRLFDPKLWYIQISENKEWISELGINYTIGIDGLSLPLVILTCFMTLTVLIFSYKTIKYNINQYNAYFLIMQGMVCGVFVAMDSILFYVFFEAMLIPMFLIIGIWGGSNRVYATIKFFIYTFLGSVFFLLALIYMHYALFFTTGEITFSILDFQEMYLSINQQKILFWAMLLAFAVKVPMWPVHTWLPDAHVEAPTGGSVILAAITLKVGGYGIIRFLLPIVPDGCLIFSNIIITLSFIAIVYIGFVAIVQRDMKKLVAYSSISHMGFVTLGCFLVFSFNSNFTYFREAVIGIEGSIIQMISHGFVSGAMFICVGILYERLHTKLISEYGGVANKMPIFATLFMIFIMANSGLPGTSGFVGELLVILTAFKVNYIYALLAGLTLILGATYNLWMYKRVIFGTIQNNSITKFNDIFMHEKIPLILLASLVIIFGVWPAPLLEVIHTSVEHLVYQAMQSKIF